MLGTSALDHVHPDDREAVASADARRDVGRQPGHAGRRCGSSTSTAPPSPLEGVGYNGLDAEVGGIVVSLRDMRERDSRFEGLTTNDLRYRALAVAAQDAIVTVDEDGRVWSWNEGARRMLGYAPEDAIGGPLSAVLPSGLPEVGEVVEVDAYHLDGHVVPVEVSVSSYELHRLPLPAGDPARHLRPPCCRGGGPCRRPPVPHRLRRRPDRHGARVARRRDARRPTRRCAGSSATSPSSSPGCTTSDITHPDDLAADDDAARRLVRDGSGLPAGEALPAIRRRLGVGRRCRSASCSTRTGQPDHVVAQVEDITERRAGRRRARVPGAARPPHRAAEPARLRRAASSRRWRGATSARSTLLFLDLDGFKDVNDSYGHSVGDDVLRVVAGRIAETLRPQDIAARIGGDEFVALARGHRRRAGRGRGASG